MLRPDRVRSNSSSRVINVTTWLNCLFAIALEQFARNWPELFTASTTSSRQHWPGDWIGRHPAHSLFEVVGQRSDERFAVHFVESAHPGPSKSQLVQVGKHPLDHMRARFFVGQVGRGGVALPGPGDGLVMGAYPYRSSQLVLLQETSLDRAGLEERLLLWPGRIDSLFL